MPNNETPRERYRRLAEQCLAVAKTMPEGEARTTVLEMALEWRRLANEYAGSTILLFDPIQSEQPAMQQQQQIQPDDDKKD